MREVADATGKFPTGYRYSMVFINRMTGVLIIVMLACIGGAFAVGAIGGDDAPAWVEPLAIGVLIGGIGLPLLIAAWLGGSSLHRYGGWAGALLIVGMALGVTGQLMEIWTWFWIGAGIDALCVLVFFYLGFLAKVPMWLQLPIIGSPRFYLSHGEQGEAEKRG
ncbi:hypothetical protein [Glaciihabitans sp. UYNi722]|uniref:hypothetical protein n=1 Tax=Glaciihabitans sp. UYNi722 TaxID=3156344 RepID=UPI003391D910